MTALSVNKILFEQISSLDVQTKDTPARERRKGKAGERSDWKYVWKYS